MPSTSFPACPTAVDTGQFGIAEYGNSSRPNSSSANPPSPLPSTTATRGRNFVRDSTYRAASSITSANLRSPAFHTSIPAKHADMKFAIDPTATAFNPSRHEALVDYIDFHGGRLSGPRDIDQGGDPRILPIGTFVSRMNGVASRLEALVGCAEFQLKVTFDSERVLRAVLTSDRQLSDAAALVRELPGEAGGQASGSPCMRHNGRA